MYILLLLLTLVVCAPPSPVAQLGATSSKAASTIDALIRQGYAHGLAFNPAIQLQSVRAYTPNNVPSLPSAATLQNVLFIWRLPDGQRSSQTKADADQYIQYNDYEGGHVRANKWSGPMYARANAWSVEEYPVFSLGQPAAATEIMTIQAALDKIAATRSLLQRERKLVGVTIRRNPLVSSSSSPSLGRQRTDSSTGRTQAKAIHSALRPGELVYVFELRGLFGRPRWVAVGTQSGKVAPLVTGEVTREISITGVVSTYD